MFLDSVYTESSVLNIEEEEPKFENFHEASLCAIAESEANYNAIMKVMAITELKALKETGEVAISEASISGFWEKIKNFFLKLWAKIKGIFHRFMTRFTAYTKSGYEFLKKYEKEFDEKFSKLDKDSVKFVGYKFTNLEESVTVEEIAGVGGVSITDLKDLAEKGGGLTRGDYANKDATSLPKGEYSDVLEKMRGAASSKVKGAGGQLDASEFSKELFEAFRDGESSKTELDSIDREDVKEPLREKRPLKQLQKDLKDMERSINSIVKASDSASKEAASNARENKDALKGERKTTSNVNVALGILKDAFSIVQTFNGAKMQAMKDQIMQSKKFMGIVLRSSVGRESKAKGINASYEYEDDSLFSQIKFQ